MFLRNHSTNIKAEQIEFLDESNREITVVEQEKGVSGACRRALSSPSSIQPVISRITKNKRRKRINLKD